MQSIFYERARDVPHALQLGSQPGARYIGGGTNLLDLMKGDVEHPARLVDVTHAGLDRIEALPNGWLRIGAVARNSDTANHPLVRTRYPLLTQALLSGASPQLRNMATMAGNLLQRTRCPYFTDTAFDKCNKRMPGSGCGAREGWQRMHAILGASDACIAVNPSDMNVALAALDGVVAVAGQRGERRIPVTEFHRLPGNTPQFDTVLQPGELITGVELPPPQFNRYHYLKLRDRASYAFALVSAAVLLQMDGNTISHARVALGGVAHKPWRVPAAEALLTGVQLTDDVGRQVAAAMLAGASAYRDNQFKVELAQRAVVRALRNAAEGREAA
ncbi:xanthine dehydrogenase family protein subunit M [Pseudoduganella ginsengisoli]|uniref:Xanthine dehydrogenase family protein subunit M n=1 Tax=Pseudoduganella ginsengisoli TaxID=1462440 RepID=A0A6L6PVB7_9BURK|nr:xanthine dehydrogenase family protein subunit M [Pseudoduganella ginsengisoli]MTW01054.1 xanthine dehydrogenase family protein subunit M [Pseudoduganella ginsengisoli]